MAIAEFVALPVAVDHARFAGLMNGQHKDPFDRLVAVQAIMEGLFIVTADPKLAEFGAPLIW